MLNIGHKYSDLEAGYVFLQENICVHLKNNLDKCIRLPMVESARSLNLSNTVAIMVYEVLRQLDYPGLSKDECQKGADFLERNNLDEVF